MKIVEIYTSPFCGYCHAAKGLLKSKSVSFQEVDISGKPQLRSQMMARANGNHTVPQILIGGIHIGGCDELHALENSGKLDSMLAA
jgi:glutaredoxin 3